MGGRALLNGMPSTVRLTYLVIADLCEIEMRTE